VSNQQTVQQNAITAHEVKLQNLTKQLGAIKQRLHTIEQREKNQNTKKNKAETKANKKVSLSKIFKEQVKLCKTYYKVTGRHLPICGELGEVYAELKYGFERHKPNTSGSDGRKGNDLIEVKTITPISSSHTVTVKRAGNFNKLCVVKISENYKFEARMITRKDMGKGEGKLAKVSWSTMLKQPK